MTNMGAKKDPDYQYKREVDKGSRDIFIDRVKDLSRNFKSRSENIANAIEKADEDLNHKINGGTLGGRLNALEVRIKLERKKKELLEKYIDTFAEYDNDRVRTIKKYNSEIYAIAEECAAERTANHEKYINGVKECEDGYYALEKEIASCVLSQGETYNKRFKQLECLQKENVCTESYIKDMLAASIKRENAWDFQMGYIYKV